MIKLPEDFIAAEYEFDSAIPTMKLEMGKAANDSVVLRASCGMNEIEKFARQAAREINTKVEAAIMDELLKLNGYIPKRACQMVFKSDGVYCSNCNERMDDYTCDWLFNRAMEYSYPYCYNCGTKVVKND